MRKLLCMLFAGIFGVASLAMTGCTTKRPIPGGSEIGEDVYVTVIDAGFGAAWMESLADAYYELTGITVHVASDPQLVSGVETKMGTSAEKDDIYFVPQGVRNWLLWTAQDLIEPLDDVLASDRYGTPAAQRYRSDDDTLKEIGVFNGKQYLLPYIYSMWGLVYNQNYLDRIESYGAYVKGEFPSTMQGLIDLCAAVRKANLVNGRTGRTVSPFSAGLTVNYMDYLYFKLWYENDPAGFEAYWDQNDRAAYDSSEFDSAESLAAMELIFDLIGATGETSSNLVGAGQNHLEAQNSFVNGDCVFTFSGSWFETETSLLIPQVGLTNYHFAAFPSAGEGDMITTMNLPGEYLFIPSDAYNVAGAKDFLTFMISEQGVAVMQRALSQQAVFTTGQSVTLMEFGQDIAEVAEKAQKVYTYANTDIYNCGALRLFEQTTNPFLNMARYGVKSKSDIRSQCISTEVTQHRNMWSEYIKNLS